MENTTDKKDIIIAFLSGALAGGALAYILQTEKGQELVEEASDAAKKKIQESKEIIKETEQEIQDKFKKALDQIDVDNAVEKGKEIMDDKFSKEA